MKKLLLFGALLCALCSCGSGNSKKNAASSNAQAPAPANVHEGHEWVDLGLPSGLKWATCNVGASSPSDYGDYYAFEDVNAAIANWGGNWRMPTKTELQELFENCDWTWTIQNDHNGYQVTGQNGNSIFLPAAGSRSGDDKLIYVGAFGQYRSCTPSESNSRKAYILHLRPEGRSDGVISFFGNYGCSVRPVLD